MTLEPSNRQHVLFYEPTRANLYSSKRLQIPFLHSVLDFLMVRFLDPQKLHAVSSIFDKLPQPEDEDNRIISTYLSVIVGA